MNTSSFLKNNFFNKQSFIKILKHSLNSFSQLDTNKFSNALLDCNVTDTKNLKCRLKTHHTACLGVEGNGPNFPAHIGAYIALLEHNIMPVATIGGSSGAITGSVLMALLENPSLDTQELSSVSLNKPQKAALVLAASDLVFDSFIFFPNLRNFSQILMNWLKNFFTQHYLDCLVTNPNTEVIDVKNMVGQVVLALDFFRITDFTKVIEEPNYSKRCQLLKELWVQHSGAIDIRFSTLLKLLFQSSSNKKTPLESEAVARFYQLTCIDSLKQSQPHLNNRIILLEKNIQNWSIKTLINCVKKIARLVKYYPYIPGSSTLRKILNRKITLLEPNYVLAGYQGFSKTGEFLEIPSGMVIHSTFRKGSWTQTGLYENSGWVNLYQAYFPASELTNYFVERRDCLLSNYKGFLSFVKDQESNSLIPPERILILPQELDKKTRGYSFALQATSAETGYFKRYPLTATPLDRYLNPNVSDHLFSFGGWLEKTPISAIADLPIGKTADYFITLSRRDSVPWFSRKAFHAVLGAAHKKQAKTLFKAMDELVNYSKSLSGRNGTINILFDNEWNNPVLTGKENFFIKDILVGLLPNRKAHMLIGYLEVIRVLQSQSSHYKNEFSTGSLTWGVTIPLPLCKAGKRASRETSQEFWNFLSNLE